MRTIAKPMAVLSLGACLALILPLLMMEGMFMDATQYTAVGRNMAHGIGSFWFPYFTYGFGTEGFNFHEQPPLGFGIFAVLFKLFGSSLYVERFYIFFTYLATIWLTAVFWKTVMPDLKKLWWLPVLLFTIIPVVHWSYQQNMLENTMSIFVLAGAIFGFKACIKQRWVWYSIGAGAFLFLAFMVKGVPGLFPLVVPFIFWVTHRKISLLKSISVSVLTSGVVVVLMGLLFLFPQSSASMEYYFVERLMGRIASDPTVESRFFILSNFLEQIIIPLALVVIGFLMSRVRNSKWPLVEHRTFLFFLFTGLCGIVPIMLTLVQRGFYITPAYPFIALALAVAVAGPAVSLVRGVERQPQLSRIIQGISILILTGVIVVTLFLAGTPKRDHDLLHDVYAIGEAIGDRHLMSTNSHIMWVNWDAKAYFMRYYFIEFEADTQDQPYLLLYKGEMPANTEYQLLPLKLRVFDLYKNSSSH